MPKPLRPFVVLVTTPGPRVSEKITRGVLRSRLAACVNRVSGISSRYWWKGRIEESREELLILKTSRRRLAALTRWVRQNHPYEVCEVLALPVEAGNPAYLKWIEESVGKG